MLGKHKESSSLPTCLTVNMTTNYDRFGLWLGTRGIVNELNDVDLNQYRDEMINACGGMNRIIQLCLSQQDNLTLFQHQDTEIYSQFR